MDSAEEEIYFQKLQEFIQDDDKIVTVSSLASELGISLQNSRQLIGKYVDDQRKLKPNELTVTYVLTGTLKDSKGRGVFMVKEDDLKQQRDLFANVPYEVVYSVQKCKNVDFNIIALIDKIDGTRIREKALDGSIVSKNCVKRIIKLKKLPTPPPATLKGKSAFFAPKPSKSEDTSKSTEKQSPKAEPKNKATGGIASLFKAAAAKSSQKDAEKSSTSKVSKPAGKQNGGLAGFLTNGALNPSKSRNNGDIKKETDVMKEAGSVECITIKDDEADVIDVNVEDKPGKRVKHEESKVKKKPASQGKQNKNKRQRDKSQETPAKKRKRIVERNDSDSDDLFEKEEDNEDIVEKSDDEPERAPSPAKKEFVPKNKRRKAVTRNYEDEEGFIVTQTEYIYETASEDDENEEPKRQKPEKQAEKPKPKAAEKKKVAKSQGSLMNFFYKK